MNTLLVGCNTVNSAMGGNTQKEAKAEVSWDYQKNGIMIELVSGNDLNFYANESHTLVLGVYQLADSKPFVKMLANSSQIMRTLETGKGGDGVLQLDRYIVSPGKRTTIVLDRVQDARFVGMVAGYYQGSGAGVARLFHIPLNIKTEGVVSTTYIASPAVLATRLYLGSEQIVNAEMLTYDAEKKKIVENVPIDLKNPEIKLTPEEIKMSEESSQAAMKLTN
jgi:type VI secretion system VasD/TssJ family lipoprotein